MSTVCQHLPQPHASCLVWKAFQCMDNASQYDEHIPKYSQIFAIIVNEYSQISQHIQHSA